MSDQNVISIAIATASLVAFPFGAWLVKTLVSHGSRIDKHDLEIEGLKSDTEGLGELKQMVAVMAEGIEWIKDAIRNRKS